MKKNVSKVYRLHLREKRTVVRVSNSNRLSFGTDSFPMKTSSDSMREKEEERKVCFAWWKPRYMRIYDASAMDVTLGTQSHFDITRCSENYIWKCKNTLSSLQRLH